jgi:hypothetical protein
LVEDAAADPPDETRHYSSGSLALFVIASFKEERS